MSFYRTHAAGCIVAILLLGLANLSQAASTYKCTTADGKVSYQDRPCSAGNSAQEVISTTASCPSAAPDRQTLIRDFARLSGKQVDPNDPKALQAAEAFLVTDAAKAFAFTKVHGVSMEFCTTDSALSDAMRRYQLVARTRITEGECYYRNGINLQLGSKQMAHSGKELTDALEQMLSDLRAQHRVASPDQLKKLCAESAQALRELARLYGSGDELAR